MFLKAKPINRRNFSKKNESFQVYTSIQFSLLRFLARMHFFLNEMLATKYIVYNTMY